jgi:hypothetical protein
MKKILALTVTLAVLSTAASADTVALWNFNSPANDFNPATGTLLDSSGVYSAAVIGGVTNSFGTVAGAGASDPETVDDSEIRLGSFAAQGTANKTAGIQFMFSTVGYENISVIWDHYNSATASRYYRVQYTVNGGTNWSDLNVITNLTPTTWINQTFASSFAGVAAANNNPIFGVRLVIEFQSTATGAGAAQYVGVSSTYGTGGTLWMDMFTVNGSALTPNNPPFISSINNLTSRVDVATSPISFTIGDVETSAGSLTLGLTSSNPTLVNTNFSFGGSGSNRTVTITPEPAQLGIADLTIRVTDGGGKFSDSTFRLTILPTNTVPTITGFPHQFLSVGGATTNLPFTISDLESNPSNLTVTVSALNTTLLPPGGVTLGGAGASRTLQLTPAANQAGATWVTVVVSDGNLSASNSFMLKVLRSQIITLWDFNSSPPDNNTSTGTLIPAIGSGTASSAGGATNSLNSNVAAVSFDPTTNLLDNSKWRFGNFPTQGTSNKISGADFRVSTVGYQNIAVTWDHYNSASGNRYWRLQYTLDGINFTDTDFVHTNPLEVTWFPVGTSLAAIPGANNNPNFGIRIVSEFESTANGGATTNEYMATQTSGGYSPNGTLWLDTVTFSGDVLAAAPPTLAIVRVGSDIKVFWPTAAAGFTLKSKASLDLGAWIAVPEAPAIVGTNNVVTITNAIGNQFYRLEQ